MDGAIPANSGCGAEAYSVRVSPRGYHQSGFAASGPQLERRLCGVERGSRQASPPGHLATWHPCRYAFGGMCAIENVFPSLLCHGRLRPARYKGYMCLLLCLTLPVLWPDGSKGPSPSWPKCVTEAAMGSGGRAGLQALRDGCSSEVATCRRLSIMDIAFVFVVETPPDLSEAGRAPKMNRRRHLGDGRAWPVPSSSEPSSPSPLPIGGGGRDRRTMRPRGLRRTGSVGYAGQCSAWQE